MRENKVKRTLARGGVAIGTMVFEFRTPGIGRICAAAGADFVVFDQEHTGWSEETVGMLVATSRAADLAPLVRVPATQYHLLARPLDVGVMGLMVPMVESEEQARFIVESAKYPPDGRRGAAFGVAHDDYQGGDILESMRTANREQLLIAQIETAAGVESVERIATVPGIDVLWIGHFDLSNSLGIPGQFDHPEFRRAVRRVLQASSANGKAAGFMVSGVEDGKAKLAQGFRCLAYSGDLWVFLQALHDGISALRVSAV